MKKISVLLDFLGVRDNFDLDYATLSGEDWNWIQILYDALVNNNGVDITVTTDNGKITTGQSAIAPFKIANLTVLLVIKKLSDAKCKLSNFFAERLNIIYSDGEIQYQVTQYCQLTSEHIGTLANIDFNAILADIKRVGYNMAQNTEVNNLLLRTLLAYDNIQSKRADLLDFADNLAQWLMHDETSPDGMRADAPFYNLNILQTKRRRRNLTSEERAELHKIIETNIDAPAILFGAYVLLEDTVSAEKHFNRLSQSEQDAYKLYPIFNLWRHV